MFGFKLARKNRTVASVISVLNGSLQLYGALWFGAWPQPQVCIYINMYVYMYVWIYVHQSISVGVFAFTWQRVAVRWRLAVFCFCLLSYFRLLCLVHLLSAWLRLSCIHNFLIKLTTWPNNNISGVRAFSCMQFYLFHIHLIFLLHMHIYLHMCMFWAQCCTI